MMEWLDLSGIGPYLARFRRWIDRVPNRDFFESSPLAKLGRLALILVTVCLTVAPLIWLFKQFSR